MKTLAEKIAHGETTLLGVDEICTRLSVSRTTFDRWVRNGGGKGSGTTPLSHLMASTFTGASLPGVTRMIDQAENMTEGRITFPPPDIRIGNSPRWELATLVSWLNKHMTTKPSELP